jgi:glutamate--cysteine ligase
MELDGRADAEAFVASTCFTLRSPRRVGVELEWIVQHADDPTARLDARHLADALGVYAPRTIAPASPALPLPCGSALTVEPGGQVEVSTPPFESIGELIDTASADTAAVEGLLAEAGLRLAHTGSDPHREPDRLVFSPRYDAMYDHYQLEGPCGARMMCCTAAVQVCLDAGTAQRVAHRWSALHALGPVLVAAFANSPRLAGVASGFASSRMAQWAGIGRGAHPPVGATGWDGDPATSYARHALEQQVLCVRCPSGPWLRPAGLTFGAWLDGVHPDLPRPTTEDLAYHLTTLFPPVRPQGHLEVRYLDAQPAGRWPLPLAVLTALLADDATTDAAVALAAPSVGRWDAAARCGLADPVLASVAVGVFELACRRLAGTDAPAWLVRELESVTERRVRLGLGVAVDDPLEVA